MYQKITQELRKTLLTRGLAFTEIDEVQDVAELDLLFVESEKDEKTSELLREIKLVVDEKRQIAQLLEMLKQRIADDLIAADIGKFTQRDLERQLMLATRRVEKIRNCIAEM